MKPPIFIGGFFIYTIMKNLKVYKAFEAKDDNRKFYDAKRAVEEALLTISDLKFKVDVFADKFDGDKEGDFNCFSVIISKLKEGSDFELEPFNFQDILDDVWHSFSIPSDYNFYFYSMTLSADNFICIWSPLDVENLEESLEDVGKVTQVTLAFTKEGYYKELIDSNKSKENNTLPNIKYK